MTSSGAGVPAVAVDVDPDPPSAESPDGEESGDGSTRDRVAAPARVPAARSISAADGLDGPLPDGAADSGFRRLGKIVATLAGSTTVITALLFYFGWSRAYYFYYYFGIDSSLLGLTTRDYIQLSVDGLFVPIMLTASVAFLLFWVHAGLQRWMAHHRPRRSHAFVLGGVGLLLVGNGISAIYVETPLNRGLGAAPLSLALGAVLLFYGVRVRRRVDGPPTTAPGWVLVGEWGALAALVGLAAFWMSNDYSAEVGENRARELVSQLPDQPRAQVFSAQSLSLSAPGVREVRCADDEAAYRYRYDGLTLVLQAGDEYLLLPSSWSRADGVAILLPRNDTIRLQFTGPGTRTRPSQEC